jgi:Ca2+-binding RTX toxin-like protein
LGGGANRVIGGAGADTISSGAGADQILGDHGVLVYSASGVLLSATTTLDNLGGADVIQAGEGDNLLFGGQGGDTLGAGSGNDIVLGDGGNVQFSASGQRLSITTNNPDQGGNDSITLTGGDNVVLGGFGNDQVTTGSGNDIILGDHGVVSFTAGIVGTIDSTDAATGGNDVIVAGNGSKTVIGGIGADTISAGVGSHTLAGDNARLIYGARGSLSSFSTTNSSVGGDDTITAADGDSIVLGGFGNDVVTTGAGNDVLIGDNGFTIFDGLGRLASVQSIDPLIGGDDTLASGDGSGILIGGSGADTLLGGTGWDILIGDGGRVGYVDGVLKSTSSVDLFIGAADKLNGGGGQNVLIGGAGKDIFVGSLSNDVILDNYGSVRFNGEGHVISVFSPAGATDLIAQVQERLYAFGRSLLQANVLGTVFVAPVGGNDATMRLADFVTLSTLSGFEFTHSSEAGGSENSALEDDAATDSTPADPSHHDSDEPKPTDTTEKEMVTSKADVTSGQRVMTDIVWNDAPPSRDSHSVAQMEQMTQRGEMMLAGWMGAQTWYSRQRSLTTGAAVAGTSAKQRFGRWIPAAGWPQSEERLMLDRRSDSRANPVRHLAAGSIERTAQEWLDGPFGLHSSIQDMSYGDKMANHAVIDWGPELEHLSMPAKERGASF